MDDTIMVIATIAIALFSGISCLVACRIHQSTKNRDGEIDNILKNLTAATLVSAQGIGYEETIIDSFKTLRKKLDEPESI